jgi:glycosyltransferase involved in cell wall biosynthesis
MDADIPEGYDYLRCCSFAVAPYEPGTISQYTDPGKVKNYLSCGLPVVLTKVPLIWKEIVDNKAGLAVRYNKEELQLAMMRLMTDKKLVLQYRDNAYLLGKRYRWDKIFKKGLQ